MERKIEVNVTLMDGTQLSFITTTKEGFGITKLGDGYILSGSYKLYKVKGNVLCGEELEYKELSIKITK